jgi:hypothetical protein
MDLPLLRFAHRLDCYFNGVGRIRPWKQWPRAIRLHPSVEVDLEQVIPILPDDVR